MGVEFGGAEGMEIVIQFLQDVSVHLSEGASIALEVGHDQGPRTGQLCTDHGLIDVQVCNDLAGVNRFVLARKAPSETETGNSAASE